jgi:hypothetical protein
MRDLIILSAGVSLAILAFPFGMQIDKWRQKREERSRMAGFKHHLIIEALAPPFINMDAVPLNVTPFRGATIDAVVLYRCTCGSWMECYDISMVVKEVPFETIKQRASDGLLYKDAQPFFEKHLATLRWPVSRRSALRFAWQDLFNTWRRRPLSAKRRSAAYWLRAAGRGWYGWDTKADVKVYDITR